MAHAVVSQEQLLVVGCVAAMGATMKMVAVSRCMPSQVAQAHRGEGTLVAAVQCSHLFVYLDVLQVVAVPLCLE